MADLRSWDPKLRRAEHHLDETRGKMAAYAARNPFPATRGTWPLHELGLRSFEIRRTLHVICQPGERWMLGLRSVSYPIPYESDRACDLLSGFAWQTGFCAGDYSTDEFRKVVGRFWDGVHDCQAIPDRLRRDCRPLLGVKPQALGEPEAVGSWPHA